MTTFQTYLILKLNVIQGLCVFITIIAAGGLMIYFIYRFVEGRSKYDPPSILTLQKYIKKLMYTTIIFGSIAAIMPNTKDVILMYSIPAIINSEAINKLSDTPEKLIDILNSKINEQLESLKKK
jgi:hypothetical protein